MLTFDPYGVDLRRDIDACLALTPDHPLVYRFTRLADRLLDLITEGGAFMPWQTDGGARGFHVDGWRLSACDSMNLSERVALLLASTSSAPRSWACALEQTVNKFNAACLDWFMEFKGNRLVRRMPHAAFNKADGGGAARIRLLDPWTCWSADAIYELLTGHRGRITKKHAMAAHYLLCGLTRAMAWKRDCHQDWLHEGHVLFADGTGKTFPTSQLPSEILSPAALDAIAFIESLPLSSLTTMAADQDMPQYVRKRILAYLYGASWMEQGGGRRPARKRDRRPQSGQGRGGGGRESCLPIYGAL